jgi:hypothetical protein
MGQLFDSALLRLLSCDEIRYNRLRRIIMPVDGTYQIEVDTPMGKMEEKLFFKTEGNVLTGKVESQMGAHDFTGKVDGHKFNWESEIEGPMGKMQLTFIGEVNGDNISGDIKVAGFGSSPFKGKRV